MEQDNIEQEEIIDEFEKDVLCSRSEMVRFLKSNVWMELKDFIVKKKEAIYDSMRIENDMTGILRAQGALELIDDLLTHPQYVIDALETEEQTEEEDG